MFFEDINFELKDGRKALIRKPREEDTQQMLDYLKITSGETEFILRYPQECERFTYDVEKELIGQMNSSETTLVLVCMIDGELAGNCCINWDTKIKTRHRASVAIALYKKYWGLGIGTKMFECMEAVAQSNPDIIQMELEFIEGNSRARGLYEKMGFRITGVRPNAIRLKDGTLLNEYMMVKELRRTV